MAVGANDFTFMVSCGVLAITTIMKVGLGGNSNTLDDSSAKQKEREGCYIAAPSNYSAFGANTHASPDWLAALG